MGGLGVTSISYSYRQTYIHTYLYIYKSTQRVHSEHPGYSRAQSRQISQCCFPELGFVLFPSPDNGLEELFLGGKKLN